MRSMHRSIIVDLPLASPAATFLCANAFRVCVLWRQRPGLFRRVIDWVVVGRMNDWKALIVEFAGYCCVFVAPPSHV